jgi:Mor family transcriptional regulator
MPAADRPELTLTAPDPAALADAAAALPDDRLPAAVRELADLAADELRRADAGLAPADCRRLGVRLAARLTDQYGGATYYWPKSDALQRAIRDLTLWAEHDGTVDGPAGIRALARRWGLTEVYVWRILARERERHLRGVQRALPL